MSGGAQVAQVLVAHGIEALFTLCGGHISPILVEAKRRGLRVVDVRDESAAVFAADATARVTGGVGVAAVTAGPGVTNAVTALENARLAQSPVVLLGGGAATALRGRGALQDIDQRAAIGPHVKWLGRARRVREIGPLLELALQQARDGVPGPAFLECPVDLLYPEEAVRRLYLEMGGRRKGALGRLLRGAVQLHLRRLFAGPESPPGEPVREEVSVGSRRALARAGKMLAASERPLLLVGSQALLAAGHAASLAAALGRLGIPVYLSGMARGLLGPSHALLQRHARRRALREADLVILAGVACDFRLDYGMPFADTPVLAVNRSQADLTLNRQPQLAIEADPMGFLLRLAERGAGGAGRWDAWLAALRVRDEEREGEIEQQAAATDGGGVNPLALCRAIDRALGDDSVLVVDGGDFVATAAYTVRPRGPLRWLDPGPFGTLGVGGGFALGAKVVRPGAEVWLLWGDGSAAFSLAELDTCARHGLPIIAVVGNDAGWTQIARDQKAILGDDVGTTLARTDYHRVAEGYGAAGLLLERTERAGEVLAEAKAIAAAGRPVLVNALLGASEFRAGSLSM